MQVVARPKLDLASEIHETEFNWPGLPSVYLILITLPRWILTEAWSQLSKRADKEDNTNPAGLRSYLPSSLASPPTPFSSSHDDPSQFA